MSADQVPAGRELNTAVALELAVKALSATVDRTTGYDWNADPDVVTRLQGDAFAAAQAALEDTHSLENTQP